MIISFINTPEAGQTASVFARASLSRRSDISTSGAIYPTFCPGNPTLMAKLGTKTSLITTNLNNHYGNHNFILKYERGRGEDHVRRVSRLYTAHMGYQVLMIDLEVQANLSTAFLPEGRQKSFVHIIRGDNSVHGVEIEPNLSLLSSDIEMSDAESALLAWTRDKRYNLKI